MPTKLRKIESSLIKRSAIFRPDTVNEEERTIEVSWTTGASTLQYDFFDDPYYEELVVDEKSVRLERLNAGAPLIDNHISASLRNQIGVVVRAWIYEGIGYAVIRFRSNQESLDIWNDVKEGIIRNLSVSYLVHEMIEQRSDSQYKKFLVIDWEPFELSMVPIPADVGAQTRSNNLKTVTIVRSLSDMPQGVKPPETNPEEDNSKDQVSSNPDSKELREQTHVSPEPEIDLEKVKQEAIQAERKRSSEIEKMCRLAKLQSLSRSLIDEGKSVEQARQSIFAKMAESERETSSHVTIKPGSYDEVDVRRSAIKNALLHRYNPSTYQLDETARKYRGMSLVEMVRSVIGRDGEGLGKRDIAQRAFQSTSDFPQILANVAHQSLLDTYEKLITRQNFAPLVKIAEASDFKPMRRVRLGEIPSLKLVPEGAEITSGTVGESGEYYQIATYARKFSLTRETIINDDLNAFTDIPSKWGIAAARLENILFWSIFTANQKLSDNRPLFHADHKNLAKTGSPISETSFSEAELAMSTQTGIDKRDKLNIIPKYLIVPTTLKTQAKKAVMMPITPMKTGDTNPFAGEYEIIAEPMLNDQSTTAWYMAAELDTGVDLVEMAYLDGVREPQVEFREGFDTFGVDIRASLDVGAKALDYRGFWKNEGKAVS